MAWCRGWHKQNNIPYSARQSCRTITSTQGWHHPQRAPDSTAWSTTKQSCQNSTKFHQGIVKTMPPPREKVWFENMQPLVEKNIKNWHTCQISTHKPAREPLQMSPLPAAPWAEVSADFGHLQNGKYLQVVTDEYSRYVVVDILDFISTTSVIPRLDKIFAEFGMQSPSKWTTAHHSTATNSKPMPPSPDSDTGE